MSQEPSAGPPDPPPVAPALAPDPQPAPAPPGPAPYYGPPASYGAPAPGYGPPPHSQHYGAPPAPAPPFRQPYAPRPYPPGFAAGPGGYYPPGFPPPPAAPSRVEPVPGTDFALAYFSVPPTVSGQAVGSLVAGIASVLVSFVVGCFGVTGARAGWGPLVGGAFAVLAAAAGIAAIGLGWFSRGQVARAGGRLVGRGMATAGIVCGAVGLGLTAVAMVLALLI
jgi:hypothetical protein